MSIIYSIVQSAKTTQNDDYFVVYIVYILIGLGMRKERRDFMFFFNNMAYSR